MKPYRITLFIITLIGILALISLYPKIELFFKIDSCLDKGGSWNYKTLKCDFDEIVTKSPNNVIHNGYNQLANKQKREQFLTSEYNKDIQEIKNIIRPEKPIIRNLSIDTTQAFGIWIQDPKEPHADFWLTSKSFLVVDYDGDGHMPYILDGNRIAIYYNDFIQRGIIISTGNKTLKIKWSNLDIETEYIKFENTIYNNTYN